MEPIVDTLRNVDIMGKLNIALKLKERLNNFERAQVIGRKGKGKEPIGKTKK
jgi:hypothetical protein